jgi:hypothetical protein
MQIRLRLCIALGLTMFSAVGSIAANRENKGEPLYIGKKVRGFHITNDLWGKTIYWTIPDEHFIYMVEDALGSMNRPKNILLASSKNLKNGISLLDMGRNGKVIRLLVFDEDELDQFGKHPGDKDARLNTAIVLLTLAHEIGHHVCGHLLSNDDRGRTQELEADRVAGAILSKSPWRGFYSARGNGPLSQDEFLEAARKSMDVEASPDHPSLVERLQAIRVGWREGTPGCRLVPEPKEIMR